MLRKITQNDADDLVQVSSFCPPIPDPPIAELSPSPPATPAPPRSNYGSGPPAAGPVCPAMRLVKGTRSDGSCWAMYVPVNYGTPIPAGCVLSGSPFPASGC